MQTFAKERSDRLESSGQSDASHLRRRLSPSEMEARRGQGGVIPFRLHINALQSVDVGCAISLASAFCIL
jgi:hypothetical protein